MVLKSNGMEVFMQALCSVGSMVNLTVRRSRVRTLGWVVQDFFVWSFVNRIEVLQESKSMQPVSLTQDTKLFYRLYTLGSMKKSL